MEIIDSQVTLMRRPLRTTWHSVPELAPITSRVTRWWRRWKGRGRRRDLHLRFFHVSLRRELWWKCKRALPVGSDRQAGRPR